MTKPLELANVESEYLLISAILFNSRRLDSAADLVAAEDFADPFLGRVYGLLVREHAKGHPLNAMTARPFLEGDPGYQELGGSKFLADITSAAGALVDVAVAARQINDLAKRRLLIANIRKALAAGVDVNVDVAQVAEALDGAMATFTNTGGGITQISGEEAMLALIEETNTPRRYVVSNVLAAVDKLLGGLRAKQMVILAARPGGGKTAVAISYAIGAARAGHGVLFVSMEMSASELMARAAADMAFDGRNGIPFDDINSAKPSPAAMRAMHNAAAMLADLPFHIVDAGTLKLGRLDMIIRRYKRRLAARGQSLDLVVVDYLQLLQCDDRRNSIYESVSEASRRLKGMAKDHEVAVLALAQMSREAEKRVDKRPVLSDLRDSGQIEQDADAVLFLYRHEYYLAAARPDDHSPDFPEWERSMDAVRGVIDFICAKRRNGVTGTAKGLFHGEFQAVRA